MKVVMIVGHGSRSLKSQEDFKKIVDITAEKMPNTKMYGTNMELADPIMDDTIDQIVEENNGLSEIVVVPFFLFEGIHIKKDIPEKLNEFREKYPNVKFTFGKPLGANPILTDILLERINEVL